jgi:hypothetical protein
MRQIGRSTPAPLAPGAEAVVRGRPGSSWRPSVDRLPQRGAKQPSPSPMCALHKSPKAIVSPVSRAALALTRPLASTFASAGRRRLPPVRRCERSQDGRRRASLLLLKSGSEGPAAGFVRERPRAALEAQHGSGSAGGSCVVTVFHTWQLSDALASDGRMSGNAATRAAFGKGRTDPARGPGPWGPTRGGLRWIRVSYLCSNGGLVGVGTVRGSCGRSVVPRRDCE